MRGLPKRKLRRPYRLRPQPAPSQTPPDSDVVRIATVPNQGRPVESPEVETPFGRRERRRPRQCASAFWLERVQIPGLLRPSWSLPAIRLGAPLECDGRPPEAGALLRQRR